MYRFVQTRPVSSARNSSVKSDQLIHFRGPHTKKNRPHNLRPMNFYNEEQKRNFPFLATNS